MKKIFFLALVVMFVIAVFPATLFSQTAVYLSSLDWPPYIGSDLKDNGMVAKVVEAAFARSNYRLEIEILPWESAVSDAIDGVYSGYFPEYYADYIKEDFVFSDPFVEGPLVLMKRKGDNISYTKLSDLKNYVIGVVAGYVNTEAFDSADYLTKEEGSDDLQNIKKLLDGKLDLIVIDTNVAKYLIDQNLPGQFGKVEFLKPVLEIKSLYICFSKTDPNVNQIVKAFNSGLAIIKRDGTLKKILTQYGF